MTTLQVKPIQINEYLGTYYVQGLEKEMATHSSVLAWRTPGTGEPGPHRAAIYGVTRVGHD